MEKTEKYADLKHNGFTIKLVVYLILGGILLVFIAFWEILYPIRNSKSGVAAQRFIQNNEVIKSEIGEIIIENDSDTTSKSQEIARSLKNGEDLTKVFQDGNKKNSEDKFRKLSDDNGVLIPKTVRGTKKTIEVEIYLTRYFAGEFTSIEYFVISKAKYREINGEWKEIPISWFENYFLLFK